MEELGRLEEIKNLRSVWNNEASDFTPWLAKDENISLLANALDIDITVDEIESSVGDFYVDIFASETGTDRKIIIENQLEDSNHDHLGKLMTYAAGKSAEIIIWLVKHAREEHRAAIEWLNNHTSEKIGFFLCEIKLYRIGDSKKAVKFEVIEQPNNWVKEANNESFNDIEQQRYNYWAEFQDYAFNNTNFANNFRRRKPSKNHWLNFFIGSSECHIAVLQIRRDNELIVELHINDNKDLFNELFQSKDNIESKAELKFEWLDLPDRKASRIIIKHSAYFNDRSQWPSQFEWLVEVMIKIKQAFGQFL